jgi:hypothetical protein
MVYVQYNLAHQFSAVKSLDIERRDAESPNDELHFVNTSAKDALFALGVKAPLPVTTASDCVFT